MVKLQDMAARQISWTPTMSLYMLAHLCGLLTGGHRPGTSFKNVHWNGCAAAMNEHFQRTDLIGTHITNHTRTWKRKYKQIVHLKSLSGALWDEDNFMIVLDHEHYTNHIKVSIFLPFSTCQNWFHLSKILVEMSFIMKNSC